MTAPAPILVSACLLGVACRYDATAKQNPAVADYLRTEGLTPLPICPEQLGGLPTPRPKAWFACGDGRDLLKQQGQLIDEAGGDPGRQFLRGAEESLKIARFCGCTEAILKQRSPSCGSRQIYRQGELFNGRGVTAALLEQEGLKVRSEEDLS